MPTLQQLWSMSIDQQP